MTDELDNLVDMIHRLKLEEKKLELEKSIAQLKAKHFIDEECVGCAGHCMVVDLSVQKELDTTRDMYLSANDERYELRKILSDYKETIQIERMDRVTEKASINRKYSEDLRKKNAAIEDLKDSNIEDLKELYDIYEGELFAVKAVRGSIISLGQEIIDNLEAELRGVKADRKSIKSDRDIMFQNYRNTVAKLQDGVRGLEAELSTRKEDSDVLMKVVERVKSFTDDTGDHTNSQHMKMRGIIEDYLDAPEGPQETPIDEPQEITVTIAYRELP